ncbi:Metallo-dependent phosphatase [Exidia glandulosa HHB12029]|uniref:Metallo-dependent phosphatase n=1 Tax=Exidia glandulosa HHB12029 TaxID=1314781 RepID=A0A165H8P6_EXIGL|nr:Metallo-dependent phosphatase [Exidia glandulosa HHB12029]
MNTLLFLAALHMTLQPFITSYDDVAFTRVGAVLHNSVKIQARYPALANSTATVRYRSAAIPNASWKDGPTLAFAEENDFVAVATLKGLYPSSSYEYLLADANNTVLPYPAEPIVFRTFPDHRLVSGSRFKFLVSSCATPNFPYSPLGGNRIEGYDYLAKHLWPASKGKKAAPKPVETEAPAPEVPEQPKAATTPVTPEVIPVAAAATPESESATTPSEPETIPPTGPTSSAASSVVESDPLPTPSNDVPTEFLLFLGDFIYADVPMGRTTKEWYQRLYRRVFASSSFRKVYERLPVFTIYDDHEFKDNYAGGGADHFVEPYTNASGAYGAYLGDVNYDNYKGENYYDFRHGDVAFFVMDTRRYRTDLSIPVAEDAQVQPTMLGDKQLAALYNWLGRVNSTASWKFVVSSVPLSNLWGADAKRDAWGAFPAERDALIEVLAHVPNVVVLSGDRHQFAAVDFLGGSFLEISTSPLSMFDVPWPLHISNLKRESDELFNHTQSVTLENAQGGIDVLEPTTITMPKERLMKHIPGGNYKVTSIEVDTVDSTHPKLYIEVLINGKVKHKFTANGKPVKMSTTQALGRQLTQGFKDLLGIVRIKPKSWF